MLLVLWRADLVVAMVGSDEHYIVSWSICGANERDAMSSLLIPFRYNVGQWDWSVCLQLCLWRWPWCYPGESAGMPTLPGRDFWNRFFVDVLCMRYVGKVCD